MERKEDKMKYSHGIESAVWAFLFAVVVLVMAWLLTGCATKWHEWNKDVWNSVKAEYPECKDKQQPRTILLQGGMFFPLWNTVVLCYPTSFEVLDHEYRHACGDMQGSSIKSMTIWRYSGEENYHNIFSFTAFILLLLMG
jgi:hypothetical protein